MSPRTASEKPKETKKTILVNQIYQELSKEIPAEAIQEKSIGNPTSGYTMGYLIERLNNVLYPLGCTWKTEIIPFILGGTPHTYLVEEFGDEKKQLTTVSVHVKFTIFDPEGTPIFEKESFGGCQVINKNMGDTLKGAQTDALKKAFSYLGLGNEAFKGNIEAQKAQDTYRRKQALTKIAKSIMAKLNTTAIPSQDDLIQYLRHLAKMEITSIDILSTIQLESIAEKIGEDTPAVENKEPQEKENVQSEKAGKSDEPILTQNARPRKPRGRTDGIKEASPDLEVDAPREEANKSIFDNDTPPF